MSWLSKTVKKVRRRLTKKRLMRNNLNPLARMRKFRNAVRKGTVKENVYKAITGHHRSDTAMPRASQIPAGYVHSARRISEMM